MKTFLKTMIPFAAAIIVSACGNNANHENHATETGSHSHSAKENSRPAQNNNPVLKNDRLNAVYEHYAVLTAALVDGDAARSRISADAIEAGAGSMVNGSTIASAAAKITASGDIEEQRAAYETLSNEIITWAKKEGMSSGELYVEHCPMAFNDKGASWLSSSKEIRNPYFGDKMMKCGEVKETIR